MEKNSLVSSGNRWPVSVYRTSRISRTVVALALLLQFLGLCAPLSVLAVSYFPVTLYHRQEKLETPMRSGETVYLFHSGTSDVRKGVHPNDILIVNRINPSCEVREVGKIRVISYVGDTYIKGEIMEGEIMVDDIAKKGGVSFLVIFAGMCDHGK